MPNCVFGSRWNGNIIIGHCCNRARRLLWHQAWYVGRQLQQKNTGLLALWCARLYAEAAVKALPLGRPQKAGKQRAEGTTWAARDVGRGEAGGEVRDYQAYESENVRVLRASSFVVPSSCGLFTWMFDCWRTRGNTSASAHLYIQCNVYMDGMYMYISNNITSYGYLVICVYIPMCFYSCSDIYIYIYK